MSAAGHGETTVQPPISEYAKYMKNLIPANIPETYTLKPMFKDVASDENIRNGIIAFRDFLHLFCDRLISDGDMYAKPKKTNNPDSYPFLHDVNQLLIHIGYHGELAQSGGSLLVTETAPKISASKQKECLRFLNLCGFVFTGDDFMEVMYPNAPILLTGLKALSISSKELYVQFVNNAHNLFRCDYMAMQAEDVEMLDVLKDILYPLPEKIQKFAFELHRRYIDMGMTCATLYDNAVHFVYAYTAQSRKALSARDIYSKRIWQFHYSMKYGFSIFVRAKKADKYADVIAKFPLPLQEKISKGYGCDRKLYGERCQGGCQGIRIPLDDSIVDMKQDIEIWLDNEMPSALKK